MYGEDGTPLDLRQIARAIDDTEILIVGFAVCPQRLLVDLRGDDAAPPIIELVEPMRNAQERALWLASRRPSLGVPERSMFFGWPHSIDFLSETGMLSRVADRALREHGIDLGADIDSVFAQLRAMERDLVRDAIRGSEGFETLWSRAQA